MKKNIVLGVVLAIVGAGGAILYLSLGRGTAATPEQEATAQVCAKHHLPVSRCPFCDESLVETMGECPAHGVPEALCWKCEPALVAAFKVEHDWCAGHALPESMCERCKAGDLPPDERE